MQDAFCLVFYYNVESSHIPLSKVFELVVKPKPVLLFKVVEESPVDTPVAALFSQTLIFFNNNR